MRHRCNVSPPAMRLITHAIILVILVVLVPYEAKALHHSGVMKGAWRAAVPLPRPRPPLPATLKGLSAPLKSETRASVVSVELSGCFSSLVPARAIAERQDPIVGPGLCGASDLVRLKAITLADGRLVALHPPAEVRCGLAEALSDWVRGDVAPAVETKGAHLAGLGIASSYDCRPRNGEIGARLSEHATGAAIDLDELALTSGKRLMLTDMTVDNGLRAELMRSACRRFTTVLGPGSDASHEDHVHLDQLQRRGGYRICHWEVR